MGGHVYESCLTIKAFSFSLLHTTIYSAPGLILLCLLFQIWQKLPKKVDPPTTRTAEPVKEKSPKNTSGRA